MPTTSTHLNSSKFTRGEKCIFGHAVITFAGIVAVVVVYCGHACLVRHRGDRALALAAARPPPPRPAPRLPAGISGAEYRCAGAAYVVLSAEGAGGERAACGTAALHAGWSLAPARCVAARASPPLAHLLPTWTLKYDDHRTGVRRGAQHPHYGGEGAADVGLFEHERALPPSEHGAPRLCTVPSVLRHEVWSSGWAESVLAVVARGSAGERAAAAAGALSAEQCRRLAAPVTPATPTLLCLVPRLGSEFHLVRPLLGALAFEGSQLVGIASWGSGTDDNLPLVVVAIAPFKHWLETTMKLLPK